MRVSTARGQRARGPHLNPTCGAGARRRRCVFTLAAFELCLGMLCRATPPFIHRTKTVLRACALGPRRPSSPSRTILLLTTWLADPSCNALMGCLVPRDRAWNWQGARCPAGRLPPAACSPCLPPAASQCDGANPRAQGLGRGLARPAYARSFDIGASPSPQPSPQPHRRHTAALGHAQGRAAASGQLAGAGRGMRR